MTERSAMTGFVHWTKGGHGDRLRAVPPTLDFYQRLVRRPSTAAA